MNSPAQKKRKLYVFLKFKAKLSNILLPNAEFAFVPKEKLTDYVLNLEHPVGKHKAMVFESLLGLTVADADFFKEIILEAVLTNEAITTRKDEFGQRYVVEFDFEHNGREVIILTAWIIETNELFPRLTSCYIK